MEGTPPSVTFLPSKKSSVPTKPIAPYLGQPKVVPYTQGCHRSPRVITWPEAHEGHWDELTQASCLCGPGTMLHDAPTKSNGRPRETVHRARAWLRDPQTKSREHGSERGSVRQQQEHRSRGGGKHHHRVATSMEEGAAGTSMHTQDAVQLVPLVQLHPELPYWMTSTLVAKCLTPAAQPHQPFPWDIPQPHLVFRTLLPAYGPAATLTGGSAGADGRQGFQVGIVSLWCQFPGGLFLCGAGGAGLPVVSMHPSSPPCILRRSPVTEVTRTSLSSLQQDTTSLAQWHVWDTQLRLVHFKQLKTKTKIK